ncbi:MAG: glycosyltransferase family 4 protein [Aquabacterium sp.]|uniref:glycosyltransferase family 4 protein n=1 Tax=Aquabacterium sp. TaxID=1872578 RepID=UPI0025BFAF24|nr:glycosyltransferase family 4 protein [Aquabacterium sp.]MBI5926413.1 glycosyltransferase family 4 protein [Aquabacterium sp.]
MKILLSAFAFSPILGSECGVGWHWALSLAQKHDVTVLTHAWFRNDVEEALRVSPVSNLRMEYFHVEPFWSDFKRAHLDSQLYITYWQIRVVGFARALQARDDFDLIHHITLGSIRYPCWLGYVGKRYIAGPLGGGERAPARFYRGTPWRLRLRELIRDVVLFSFKVDPFAQAALGRADKIFCRTEDTANFIPRAMAHKVVVANEIGAPSVVPRSAPVRRKPRTTFLFAGRLMALKGLHLALDAMAQAIRHGADMELLVVGDGEMRECLVAKALALGLSNRLTMRARIPQVELMALYHEADAFLFPSLHDSGGTVVLESLSRGLPVICVDLGGPKHFLNESCGIVVSTVDASYEDLVDRLAQAMLRFASLDDDALQFMHDAAIAQASRLTWAHQVEQVYGALEA